jgi:epsin
MLRQFHYIDQNGKDQGVNVRNRAQELTKLLQDVDAIRAERKKARANRNKFGGVEGGMGMSGGFSSNSRYGGFGSDEAGFGGYQGEVYGDGGGFGGNQSGFADTQRRSERFEEYDEADDVAPASRTSARTQKDPGPRAAAATSNLRDSKQKQKEPEPDLFDFGDEPASAPSISNGKAPAQAGNVLDDFGPTESGVAADDDFDEFQSATSPAAAAPSTAFAGLSPPPTMTSTTTSSTQFAAPKPLAPLQAANFKGILSTASPALSATSSTGAAAPSTLPTYSSPAPPPPPSQPFKPSGPNYYTSIQSSINNPPVTSTSSTFSSQSAFPSQMQPSYSSSTTMASLGKPTAKPTSTASGEDAFGSLWSTATAKAGVQIRSTTPSKGPDLASMAKAKSEAGIWGTSAASATRSSTVASTPSAAPGQARPSGGLGNGLDDLLG